ncbi:hypothetical protein [Curtobacterium pusillum]|uniref:hypothetical protein n=1 Tax=Curtobacterium pusillum TaxID=69373 RepID=UPI0011AA1EFC|nr:hypothetical protein [Curtobacterium pusillum]
MSTPASNGPTPTIPPVPSAPAPVPSAPSPEHAGAAGAERVRLGWTPGQPALYEQWGVPATTPKRAMGADIGVLPELERTETTRRPLWKHPAFLVSAALALVAVAVATVMVVRAVTAEGPPTPTDLAVQAGSGNVRLSWSGPDVAWSVFVVEDGAKPVDVTRQVRGTELWLPASGGSYDDDSCFVVRATAANQGKAVPTDAGERDAQGAEQVCLGDAG